MDIDNPPQRHFHTTTDAEQNASKEHRSLKGGRMPSRTGFIATLLAALLIATATPAADEVPATGWQKSLVADLTVTQTAYSNSWAGGEKGSFSWVSNTKGKAQKQLHPKFNFTSSLKLSFGQTMIQNDETDRWEKPKKSTDLIDWENVGLFTLQGYVDPFVAFRLESQFLDASVPAKKRYLTPLVLTESAGIARRFYKLDKDEVLSRLGFAFKQTITSMIVETALLTTDKKTVTDAGIESVTDVIKSFNERLKYTGKLTFYKALAYSKSDEVKGSAIEDDWKAIDVAWENIVDAQVSKIIKVSFYTQVLYDKQISYKTRFKETLGLGFVLNLI